MAASKVQVFYILPHVDHRRTHTSMPTPCVTDCAESLGTRRHFLGEEFFINVANETDEDDGVMVVVVVVGVMV